MSRTRPVANCKTGLSPIALILLTTLFIVGCSEPSADDRAAVIAEGEAEIERHKDDPLVQPIDVPGFTLGSQSVIGARIPTDNQMPIGNNPLHQEAPTTYTYNYQYVDGDVSQEQTLDAVVDHYLSAGAELVNPPNPWSRRLLVETFNDELEIVASYSSGVATGGNPQVDIKVKILR